MSNPEAQPCRKTENRGEWQGSSQGTGKVQTEERGEEVQRGKTDWKRHRDKLTTPKCVHKQNLTLPTAVLTDLWDNYLSSSSNHCFFLIAPAVCVCSCTYAYVFACPRVCMYCVKTTGSSFYQNYRVHFSVWLQSFYQIKVTTKKHLNVSKLDEDQLIG